MTHARPHLETHARGKGHSAIAGVAYRLGLRLQDKRTGEWHDYRKRALGEDIVAAFTLAPAGAPEWATDPARVWDAVETAERRKDSQVAHDFRIPIPFGLTDTDAEAMARSMALHIVEGLRTVVSVGLHRDSPVDLLGQPKPFGKVGYHAHLYFPTRALQFDAAAIREADGEGGAGGSDGWAFGDKLKVLSQKKSAAAVIEEMNRQWAALANHHVHAQGGVPDFTHMSYKRLGLAKLPQLRLGPAATAMERQGIRTRKGDALRAAMAVGDAGTSVMDASSAVSSPNVASPPVVADTAVSVAPPTPADWLHPLDPIVVRAHASTTSVPTTAPSSSTVAGLAGRFLAELASKPELPEPTPEQRGRLVEWLQRIEKALRSLAALALRLADLRERRQRDDIARCTFLVEGDAVRQRRTEARVAVAAWMESHPWQQRVNRLLSMERKPAELGYLQGRVSSLNAQLSQFERGAADATQRVAMFDARIRTDEAAQVQARDALVASVEAVHGMQPLYGMVLLSVSDRDQVAPLTAVLPPTPQPPEELNAAVTLRTPEIAFARKPEAPRVMRPAV